MYLGCLHLFFLLEKLEVVSARQCKVLGWACICTHFVSIGQQGFDLLFLVVWFGVSASFLCVSLFYFGGKDGVSQVLHRRLREVRNPSDEGPI